jgi:hypothetical protein
MIAGKGLENSLKALREAGVFVSFEEFKGRKPIVRGGKTLSVEPGDFDNPYLKGHYQSRSGGSTGVGTRVTQDLDHYAAKAPHFLIAGRVHNLLGSPVALWHGVLPDGSGIGVTLTQAKIGNVPIKWFTPIGKQNIKPNIKYNFATNSIVQTARVLGCPFPRPEIVHLDHAHVIARWLEKTIRKYGSCMVRTLTSMAMRVCLAARNNSIDLTGVTFVGGGEPVTPAKVSAILDVGARFVPVYVFLLKEAMSGGGVRGHTITVMSIFSRIH